MGPLKNAVDMYCLCSVCVWHDVLMHGVTTSAKHYACLLIASSRIQAPHSRTVFFQQATADIPIVSRGGQYDGTSTSSYVREAASRLTKDAAYNCLNRAQPVNNSLCNFGGTNAYLVTGVSWPALDTRVGDGLHITGAHQVRRTQQRPVHDAAVLVHGILRSRRPIASSKVHIRAHIN